MHRLIFFLPFINIDEHRRTSARKSRRIVAFIYLYSVSHHRSTFLCISRSSEYGVTRRSCEERFVSKTYTSWYRVFLGLAAPAEFVSEGPGAHAKAHEQHADRGDRYQGDRYILGRRCLGRCNFRAECWPLDLVLLRGLLRNTGGPRAGVSLRLFRLLRLQPRRFWYARRHRYRRRWYPQFSKQSLSRNDAGQQRWSPSASGAHRVPVSRNKIVYMRRRSSRNGCSRVDSRVSSTNWMSMNNGTGHRESTRKVMHRSS